MLNITAFNFFLDLLADLKKQPFADDKGLKGYYITIDRSYNVFENFDSIYLGFNSKKRDTQSFIISIQIPHDGSTQKIGSFIVHDREATKHASEALVIIRKYLKESQGDDNVQN